MTNITVTPYNSSYFERWNAFVEDSNEGTLFHRLDFLAYHGERFRQQEHHILFLKGQQLFGVMPMALIDEGGRLIARSPYGGSYGGPVFERPLAYDESRAVVAALLDYIVSVRAVGCRLTFPLACCYTTYSETFRLALLEHGFSCKNRDISSVVHLKTAQPVPERMNARARRMARKAQREGVVVVQRANIDDFWLVMQKTFAIHGINPTHTLEEFRWLCAHFPERIYVDVAYLDHRPIAGIGYFVTNKHVNCSFYLCRDSEFQEAQAQSLLIYETLTQLQQSSFTWFDLGTSSVNMQGRDNIFRFKENFGAIGLFRDTYVWDVREQVERD